MTNMTNKYELTSETRVHFGRTLYRIRALLSFGGVKAGDLGGFIEKEANLSQVSDNAWVFGNAWVSGNAQVSGNAWVSDNAWVSGNARVSDNARVSGNAWVSKPITTATRSDGYTFALLRMADKSWRVSAGCRFFTMEEGRAHWTATRGGTKLGVESLAILDFFAAVIATEEGDA